MKKLFMFFIAIALIAAFSVPAAAGDAEWNFYGSARFTTFYTDTSKEAAGVHTPPDDDQGTTWTQQGNSRIGATVTSGDVGGAFEMSGTFGKRKLYGTWNFGGGQLLLGQTYTPVCIFISNQVFGSDTDMLNTGGLYDGRRPMIQVKFGGFKVALVEPSTNGDAAIIGGKPFRMDPKTGATLPAEAKNIAGGETDSTLPKLELAYTFKTDMFKVGAVGGYNTYEIEGDAKTYDVDAWVVGLWGTVNLGPAYIKANVFKAQNAGNFGLYTDHYTDDVGADAVWHGGKVRDNDALGYLAVAGVKLGDAFALEGGYGVVGYEPDVIGAKEDETSAMYVQATIGLAPGVFIIPEIGKIDYKKDADNDKEGDMTYFGAKWQINF